MSAVSVLEHARTVLDKPENWCKGESAIDVDGIPCRIKDSNVKQRCMLSAIDDYSLRHTVNYRVHRIAIDLCKEHLPNAFITAFNDAPERTHGEVIGFLDKMIEKAKERGYERDQ